MRAPWPAVAAPRRGTVRLGLLALPAVTLVGLGYARRWVAEDAFIDLRVVEHLLAGHGPVFNAGERVEAYTNPLWVALLALAGSAGLPLARSAVGLGLALTAAGLLAAQAATGRLDPGSRRLPLGSAVYAALPPAWDFATSGLESGLAVGWLGAAFWLLVRATARAPAWPAAVVLGLGPLVRPDLVVFSAAFLGALLAAGAPRAGAGPAGAGRRAAWLAAGMVLPLAYLAFRLGYFAALVPNTALAKEAGSAYWGQGGRYVVDLAGPYALWLPVAVLGPWLVRRRRGAGAPPAVTAVALAPVAAALLHALYVTRVGGDFMHGRLLLPTVFGGLLPVATVTLPGPFRGRWRRAAPLAAAVVAAWAVTCAVWLRVPYAGRIGPAGIADERGFYVAATGRANPVEPADYAATPWARRGLALRGRAGGATWAEPARPPEPRLLLLADGAALRLDPAVRPDVGLVAVAHNIGILGYLAGPAVHVVDPRGLSDPLASRLALRARSRPGHEKDLPAAWIAARFADPADPGAATPAVAAARAALRCGDAARLLAAITEPLTVTRLLGNARAALPLLGLRLPPDPGAARDALCGAPAGRARPGD